MLGGRADGCGEEGGGGGKETEGGIDANSIIGAVAIKCALSIIYSSVFIHSSFSFESTDIIDDASRIEPCCFLNDSFSVHRSFCTHNSTIVNDAIIIAPHVRHNSPRKSIHSISSRLCEIRTHPAGVGNARSPSLAIGDRRHHSLGARESKPTEIVPICLLSHNGPNYGGSSVT